MSAASIPAGKGGGYARYLESKTVDRGRGDYYLSPEGEPMQAPGRWLASPDTLARLGIEGTVVEGREFIALMEGRDPGTGGWLRPEGAGGGRGGGIDLTFSAPKSVSVMWALGDELERREIEAAHATAVEQVMEHLRETVPTVRRRWGGQVVEEHAVDLLAAEYRHTTARGVMEGDVPDPQLHSHVVITSAVRRDGRLVAVASRPIFSSSKELGAYYRSALAHELGERGYQIERGTGKNGRYFEIRGVPQSMLDAFSQRSREIARAAERFRAKWGRAPERGDLRALRLRTRNAKTVHTTADLQRAWKETAARFQTPGERTLSEHERVVDRRSLEDRVEERLTERAATFQPGDLRAVLLEQSAGDLSPQEALAFAGTMIAERRVLPLEGGIMTTLTVRAREQAIERRFTTLAENAGRDVGEAARTIASNELAERIGGRLTEEQAHALEVITGPGRGAILVGPAGTGKGVVIDAAARAKQHTGHQTLGIAVSGSTAQRLGYDSPALAGQTLTLDALVSRVQRGQLHVDEATTIYFDEAGMADTDRLGRLIETVERAGAKLVAIGDAAQLPSIGAGGMFERLTRLAPTAELSNVHRTLDPAEQRAWADLRAGRSDRAMAHYHSRGQLHMSDTRDEAVEQAAQAWAKLTETHDPSQVALISDSSNQEIHRLNARAQHFRAQRGELGEHEVPIPGVHYGIRAADRVVLIDKHHQPGQERIENGTRGQVLNITPQGEVLIEFDVAGRKRTLQGEDLARLRLGYAQHIHRAQGATVNRTLVVTGGWQTSKEPAYVEASRARQGTTWFVSRQDLGVEGHDTQRINRPRPGNATQPRTNTLPSAPRAARHGLRARLPARDRTEPPTRDPRPRTHHTPRSPTRPNPGTHTMRCMGTVLRSDASCCREMTPLLSLRSVSLGFSRGRRHVVRVLNGVSLDLDVGEVVAVLAQRAQGKTSLLRVAAGMQRPGAGRVFFDGDDLWMMSDSQRSELLARQIGLVRGVEPDIDVPMQVHVATPAAVVYGWREAHARATAALDRVGASGCAEQRWASLADWERALVVLAQGIVRRPRLLLVDDLTATLGLGETDVLTRMVGELAREVGMGVLMGVSDANATLWAGRIATLAGGELLEPTRPSGDEADNVVEFPTEERSRGA